MADHKHDHPGHGGLRAAMGPHLTDLLRAGLSVVLDWPANTATSRA